jgi:hypothetical protein
MRVLAPILLIEQARFPHKGPTGRASVRDRSGFRSKFLQ